MKKHSINFRRIGAVASLGLYLAFMTVAFQNCSGMQGFNTQEFGTSFSSVQGASSVDVDNSNNGNNIPGDKTGFAILSWDANAEENLKEYRIYYGTDPSNLNQVVTKIGLTATPGAPEVTLRGLTKGTAYYFAVTAVSDTGEESDRSDVASKTP